MASNRTLTMAEEWRSRIQTGAILTRLEKQANGEIEMTANQIKANEILLKKALPDLKAIEHTGHVSGEVTFTLSKNDLTI